MTYLSSSLFQLPVLTSRKPQTPSTIRPYSRGTEDELVNAPREQNAVDDLLHSPLGVLVLTRCIIEVSGGPPGMPCAEHLGVYPAQDMARFLQALSTREASSGYFDLLSTERLCELIAQSVAELTPYWDGYQRQTEVLLASSASLRSFAEHLLHAAGTATWFADLDRKRQEWMSSASPAPEASSFHPDLRPYGAGITKPRRALWTSTSVGEGSSGWLHYVPWGEDRREPSYHRWHLEVVPTARVYEVHGPRAWQALCLAYPAPSSLAYPVETPAALIEPNWQAVAQDWDGIHLSTGGLLTTERVRWGLPGAQTHLYGWAVESTVWLRWVFGTVQRLPDGGENDEPLGS